MVSKIFLSLIWLILLKFSQQNTSVIQKFHTSPTTPTLAKEKNPYVFNLPDITEVMQNLTEELGRPTQSSNQNLTIKQLLRKTEILDDMVRTLGSQVYEVSVQVDDNALTLWDMEKDPADTVYPQNCKEVQARGHNTTGLYFIKPLSVPEPFLVLCDMDTTGGGWTTIFRRYDGCQIFDLDWKNYKYGFGRLKGEFWLGLENIHFITDIGTNELLIEVSDRLPGEKPLKRDHYKFFSIGSEEEGYIINLLEGYEGDAGNAFSDSYGAKFSTKDKNQDPLNNKCSASSGGGWWHRNCASILLTAKWDLYNSTMSWEQTRMLIRPSPTSLN